MRLLANRLNKARFRHAWIWLSVLGFWVLPPFISAQGEIDPVTVSFVELGSQATQGATLEIPVRLSERTWFEAEVPYRVHPDSTAVEGEDFEFIAEFGQTEVENPIVFDDRRIQKVIRVRLLNNAAAIGGGSRYLIIELDEEGLKTVAPGAAMTHTLEIVDQDAPVVSFVEHILEMREGETMEIPLTVSRSVPTAIRLDFEVIPVTASGEDLITDSGAATPSPVTVSGVGQTGTIRVGAAHDGVVNDDSRRTFRIELTSAQALEPGFDLPIAVDNRHFEGTIIDVDPVDLNFLPIDGAFEQTYKERTTVNLGVSLALPTNREIRIPVSFSGMESNEFQTIEEDELVIPVEADSVFFPVSFLPRADPPEAYPKTLLVSLGQAVDEDGNEVPMGENTEFRINISKLGDLRLAFGRRVDSAGVAGLPVFEAESSRIVGRTDRNLALPVFLSDPAADAVRFRVEVVAASSTARLIPVEALFGAVDREQVDWDYFFQLGNDFAYGGRRGKPFIDNIVIPEGEVSRTLNFEFKQRLMETVMFDNVNAPAATGDVTVTLRITNIRTDDPLVQKDPVEFQLIIRDFPNVDVSSFVDSLSPVGPAVFNPLSGVFEVPFSLTFSEELDTDLLRGYRSMRFEFSSGIFDPENPDPTVLSRSPAEPTPIQPFEYQVRTPFRLAWPTLRENRVLISGDDDWVAGRIFEERHANTVLPTDIVLRNVQLPDINYPDEMSSAPNQLHEDLDLLFEFTHGGARNLDLSRIDPAVNPNGFRVTLSRLQDRGPAQSGTFIQPRRMISTADGNMLFQLRARSNARYQIQYWDGEGDWKVASPAAFQAEGTTLFWVDSGLPKTDSPSREAPFRLYRFIELDQ